jgi:hypothetical protein
MSAATRIRTASGCAYRPARIRANGESGKSPGLAVPRPASSASMALICARIGMRAGEPGQDRARLTARSRLVRSSSAAVSSLTSWSRTIGGQVGGEVGGQAHAVLLLGQHLVQPAAQGGLHGPGRYALDRAF